MLILLSVTQPHQLLAEVAVTLTQIITTEDVLYAAKLLL